MGKIVKYCAACDESFAEKFGFCPNCGQAMTAFEMNPVMKETQAVEETKTETVVNNSAAETPAPVSFETAPKIETSPVGETVAFSANQTQAFSNDFEAESFDDAEEEPVISPTENKTFAAAAGTNGNGHYETTNYNFQETSNALEDDGYHVTVIEEKNVKQRNGLLLGTMALMLTLVLGGTVYSLFNKDFGVGAIEDGSLFTYVPVVDNVPMELEEPEQPDPGKGGGGGGGGRKDNEPISKGELPPQFKDKPLLTPSKEDISVSNPSLAVMRATRGPNDIMPKNRSAVNGDPNSTNLNPSNGLSADNLGMGQNGSGGIGNNGRDGVGSNGSGGIGNADGNRYGNDPGDGGNNNNPRTPPPPPVKAPAVTKKYVILSKPRADYTDLARQNQVTGTVTVKVTFLASGQIGSVVPVNGLPYGLTEKAIAAAKAIRFEPAKRDGVPYTMVATVQYNFNIY